MEIFWTSGQLRDLFSDFSKISKLHVYVFFTLSHIAVVGTGKQISLWSVTAQRQLWSQTAKSYVHCVAVSANGRLIVSGHSNGTFQLWDTMSAEPVRLQVEAHSDNVTLVAISKDGSKIITGSNGMTLRFWNARNGEPKGCPMNHEDL